MTTCINTFKVHANIHVALQGIFFIRLWSSGTSWHRLNNAPVLEVEATGSILGLEGGYSHEVDRLQATVFGRPSPWADGVVLSLSGLPWPQCQHYGPLFKQLTFNPQPLTPRSAGSPHSPHSIPSCSWLFQPHGGIVKGELLTRDCCCPRGLSSVLRKPPQKGPSGHPLSTL